MTSSGMQSKDFRANPNKKLEEASIINLFINGKLVELNNIL